MVGGLVVGATDVPNTMAGVMSTALEVFLSPSRLGLDLVGVEAGEAPFTAPFAVVFCGFEGAGLVPLTSVDLPLEWRDL